MLAECATRSTGGPALAYAPAMRNATRITSTLFLTLIAAPGCKDDPAPNEPGEFGEPCLVGEQDNTPHGCVAGHYCYLGVCLEDCLDPGDCQPVDGWERQCSAGICHILCNADSQCPQDLGTPLVCDTVKNRCKAEETDSS